MSSGDTSSDMFQDAWHSTSAYSMAFWELLKEGFATAGLYLSGFSGTAWVYLLEAAVIFSDPCFLIVFGFAIVIYIIVSMVSYGTRKAYNYFRPGNPQGDPQISLTDVGGYSDNGESDLECDPMTMNMGGMQGVQCFCAQTQMPAEDFDEFAFDKAHQGSIVGRVIRWANIAFAGQLMDSACSTATCAGFTTPQMQPHPTCSPQMAAYSSQGGNRRHSRQGGFGGDGHLNPNGRRSCRHASAGGSPVFRGDFGERRESGYHSYRHKHRHSHSRHRSPTIHPDLMGSQPPAAPPPKQGWFKSWFAGPNKNLASTAPNAANDAHCEKTKCQCACKRPARTEHKLGGGYGRGPPASMHQMRVPSSRGHEAHTSHLRPTGQRPGESRTQVDSRGQTSARASGHSTNRVASGVPSGSQAAASNRVTPQDHVRNSSLGKSQSRVSEHKTSATQSVTGASASVGSVSNAAKKSTVSGTGGVYRSQGSVGGGTKRTTAGGSVTAGGASSVSGPSGTAKTSTAASAASEHTSDIA